MIARIKDLFKRLAFRLHLHAPFEERLLTHYQRRRTTYFLFIYSDGSKFEELHPAFQLFLWHNDIHYRLRHDRNDTSILFYRKEDHDRYLEAVRMFSKRYDCPESVIEWLKENRIDFIFYENLRLFRERDAVQMALAFEVIPRYDYEIQKGLRLIRDNPDRLHRIYGRLKYPDQYVVREQ